MLTTPRAHSAISARRRPRCSLMRPRRRPAPGRSPNPSGLLAQRADYFLRHVAYLDAAVQEGIEPLPAAAREAFAMAQWANHSSAAAAVQQMGLRFAAGSNALAALVRERQDLSAFWRERDKALLAALSQAARPAESRRDRRPAQRDCRDREQARRQRGAARTGVSGVRGAGEPVVAQGRGTATIAWP